jgi:hypothetical protein
MLFVGWGDGTYPPEHEIADLKQLLLRQKGPRMQQEIALHVAKAELADLNPRHNKGRSRK